VESAKMSGIGTVFAAIAAIAAGVESAKMSGIGT